MRLHTPLALLPLALAQNKTFPVKGDNGDMAGVFGIGASILTSGVDPSIVLGLGAKGKEFPTRHQGTLTGGSGPYKAKWRTDPTLPNHVIYAPVTPPPSNVSMPVLTFGEGGCINIGTMFPHFLTEIASHGYLVIANGIPMDPESTANALSQLGNLVATMGSKVTQHTESIDWVYKGGATKYGNVDKNRIAAGGQSCGALEAYSASYHEPRVKLTMIFNVGVFDSSRRHLLKELKSPIGYFLGGPVDPGYQFAMLDWKALPPKLPAMFASLDTGHGGTYSATNGGKFGRAAVAFLEWQFRNVSAAKSMFMDPTSKDSLVNNNWNVTSRNFS